MGRRRRNVQRIVIDEGKRSGASRKVQGGNVQHIVINEDGRGNKASCSGGVENVQEIVVNEGTSSRKHPKNATRKAEQTKDEVGGKSSLSDKAARPSSDGFKDSKKPLENTTGEPSKRLRASVSAMSSLKKRSSSDNKRSEGTTGVVKEEAPGSGTHLNKTGNQKCINEEDGACQEVLMDDDNLSHEFEKSVTCCYTDEISEMPTSPKVDFESAKKRSTKGSNYTHASKSKAPGSSSNNGGPSSSATPHKSSEAITGVKKSSHGVPASLATSRKSSEAANSVKKSSHSDPSSSATHRKSSGATAGVKIQIVHVKNAKVYM